MAEFLHRDVLKHVADARVFDMERLNPILEGSRQLAGGATELFQQKRPESRIRLGNAYGMKKFFTV
jgi:hypothetical protein